MMMERFLLTRRVIATAAVGFLAIGLVAVVVLTTTDPEAAETITLAGSVVLSAFAGVITLSAAQRIPVGERLRRRWIWLGSGVSLYAVSQGIRIFYEYVLGTPAPYPGLADAAFFASGIAVAIALFDAMAGVRRFGQGTGALIASLTISMALIAVQANLLLLDVFSDETLPAFTKAVTLYRPVADVVLCVLPALFVVFAMAVYGGRLGFPWVPVAAGAILMALADAAYAWLAYHDAYRPGQSVDFVLMAGYMFFALGALMHAEVDFEEAPPAADTGLAPLQAEAESA